eukprot:767547-Hanusia_phi.AAC.4
MGQPAGVNGAKSFPDLEDDCDQRRLFNPRVSCDKSLMERALADFHLNVQLLMLEPRAVIPDYVLGPCSNMRGA